VNFSFLEMIFETFVIFPAFLHSVGNISMINTRINLIRVSLRIEMHLCYFIGHFIDNRKSKSRCSRYRYNKSFSIAVIRYETSSTRPRQNLLDCNFICGLIELLHPTPENSWRNREMASSSPSKANLLSENSMVKSMETKFSFFLRMITEWFSTDKLSW